jgi:hypothetical protein
MLTTEQLLTQRYKVIGPYPDSPFKIGEILHRYYFKTGTTGPYTYVTNPKIILQGLNEKKENVETMPNIFQPLPWWSDRELSDLPAFLHCPSRGTYHKVDKWEVASFVTDGRTKKQMANYTPATLAEYEQYNQQNK